MAHIHFQNSAIDINRILYESHKSLIKKIATELDAKDKQDELITKFLGEPLKIKKQRDPLLPKKPKSSFLLFCDEKRSGVQKKYPDYKMGQIMKKLGEMWQNCENKQKYIDIASKAKEEYREELETYNLNNFH